MRRHTRPTLALMLLLTMTGCRRPHSSALIGINFETLQTDYWVAGLQALQQSLQQHHLPSVVSVADDDSNRQLEQVRTLLARGVDGLILVPRDAQTAIPLLAVAHKANVPVVLFNRPPAPNPYPSVTVVADNYAIARRTVAVLVAEARQQCHPCSAMILIGDLSDANAIARRQGFDDAVREDPDIHVVARVPTEWNQEKALAGAASAFQAHPDIRLIFASSDFLFPSLVAAMKSAGKYYSVGQPGHVLLGGFDGDANAARMLQQGYLDADGVQDVDFEGQAAVQALADLRAGKPVAPIVHDPGLVATQSNRAQWEKRMWGARMLAEESVQP